MTALGQGLVVVANWRSTFISVLDPANLRRTRSTPLRMRPHDVAAASDGTRVYVASEDQAVVFADLAAGRGLRSVRTGRRPHDLIEVGASVWVTDIATPAIYVLDARNGARLAALSLPRPGHDIAVRPDGKEVWATPLSGNTIFILDPGIRRLRGTLRLGRSPQHMAFSADGREIWITETTTSRIYVVDVEQRRLKATIALGGPPHHVALDARYAYVAVGPAHLVIIDLRTRAIVRRLEVGPDPHDVVVGRY